MCDLSNTDATLSNMYHRTRLLLHPVAIKHHNLASKELKKKVKIISSHIEPCRKNLPCPSIHKLFHCQSTIFLSIPSLHVCTNFAEVVIHFVKNFGVIARYNSLSLIARINLFLILRNRKNLKYLYFYRDLNV